MAPVQRAHGRYQDYRPAGGSVFGNGAPQIGNTAHDAKRFHAIRLDAISYAMVSGLRDW
jgi:hypothetical protein